MVSRKTNSLLLIDFGHATSIKGDLKDGTCWS